MAARPLAGRRRDPGRAAARDGALGRARGALELDDADRERLPRARSGAARRSAAAAPAPERGEVVLVMGIPGAGKSRVAEELVARGYLRLNRDERGGSLRELADALDEALASGARRVVLDNTYLTRASRSHVVEAAARHGVPARCVWLDTPLAQAQVNLVERLLDRFGALPSPERAAGARATRAGPARADVADARAPRARAAVDDEGFAASSACRSCARRDAARAGVFVAAAALGAAGVARRVGRRPAPRRTSSSTGARTVAGRPRRGRRAPRVGGRRTRSRRRSARTAAARRCAGAARRCPGLPLAFARAHGVDPARAALVGTCPPTGRSRRRSARATSE